MYIRIPFNVGHISKNHDISVQNVGPPRMLYDAQITMTRVPLAFLWK
jgi:hypothetical protein